MIVNNEIIPSWITNPTYLQSCAVDVNTGKPMIVLAVDKPGQTSPNDMLRYAVMGIITDVEITQSETEAIYGYATVRYNRK